VVHCVCPLAHWLLQTQDPLWQIFVVSLQSVPLGQVPQPLVGLIVCPQVTVLGAAHCGVHAVHVPVALLYEYPLLQV